MALYRVIMALAAPLLVLLAMARVLRGRETLADFWQRVGFAPGPSGQARTMWLHAASNGELASCEEVIRGLLRSDPSLRLLVTTNSTTGRTLAQDWALPHLHAQLAPFDWVWATRRLIRLWGSTGLIIVEAELWPNRITTMSRKGHAVVVIGARMSRKTARGWGKVPFLAKPVLACLTYVVPQDSGTARRLARLGVNPARIGPVTNLKAFYTSQGKPPPDPALQEAYPPHRTWLAASTHPGEDEIVLDAHTLARSDWPDLELILAPRHPARADEITAMITDRGEPLARRSTGDAPQGGAIYLADTLGEMARFYANAEICFVAGSLVPKGGHTPFEPHAHGCAIVHGPHLDNFRTIYRRLDDAGGAWQAEDAETLSRALTDLRDKTRRTAMLEAARQAIGSAANPDEFAAELLNFIEK